MYKPNSLFDADCPFALFWFDSKQISYPIQTYTNTVVIKSQKSTDGTLRH